MEMTESADVVRKSESSPAEPVLEPAPEPAEPAPEPAPAPAQAVPETPAPKRRGRPPVCKRGKGSLEPGKMQHLRLDIGHVEVRAKMDSEIGQPNQF